jgi:hypothetical protein
VWVVLPPSLLLPVAIENVGLKPNVINLRKKGCMGFSPIFSIARGFSHGEEEGGRKDNPHRSEKKREAGFGCPVSP